MREKCQRTRELGFKETMIKLGLARFNQQREAWACKKRRFGLCVRCTHAVADDSHCAPKRVPDGPIHLLLCTCIRNFFFYPMHFAPRLLTANDYGNLQTV